MNEKIENIHKNLKKQFDINKEYVNCIHELEKDIKNCLTEKYDGDFKVNIYYDLICIKNDINFKNTRDMIEILKTLDEEYGECFLIEVGLFEIKIRFLDLTKCLDKYQTIVRKVNEEKNII